MRVYRTLAAVAAAGALLSPLAVGTAATAAPLAVAAPATGAPVPALPSDVTSAPEARRVDRVPAPRLGWYRCYDGAQCATVDLPLDYDEPAGPTTEVAVLRVPARDQARRIGSLFVNPGGPGGSATEFASFAPAFLPPALLDRFDVVGVDPRGVGSSDRIRCCPHHPGPAADAAAAAHAALPARRPAGGGVRGRVPGHRRGLLDHRPAAVGVDVDRTDRARHGGRAPRGRGPRAHLPRLLLRQLPRPGLRQHVPGPGPGGRHRRRAGPGGVGREGLHP